MATKVVMPQLGESVVEGTVNRWHKQEGDAVQEYEALLEVSTDKVDTDVPAPAGGVLLKIYVNEEETVEAGVLLALIGEPGETLDDAATDGAAAQPVPEPVPVAGVAATNGGGIRSAGTYTGHVTPVVARMITEHNLDLTQIAGTGRDGRVTKKDIENYLDTRQDTSAAPSAVPAWEQPVEGDLFKPTVEYGGETTPAPASTPTDTRLAERLHPPEPVPETAPGELVKLDNMRRAIADHMVRSKLQTSPHVTSVFEIDMTAVLAHREANKDAFARQGINLTLTAYFVAASVVALRENPYVNAQWTDDGIFLHRPAHVGLAVALDKGLIVPVIKNAQDYNLLGLSRAVNDLATRARDKQLKPDEVQGGTFTITNHGVSGSLVAMPIINQPQVAILGVGVMEKRVKVIDDALAIRPMLYVSLTFDHRVIDGATGDSFLASLKHQMESWH